MIDKTILFLTKGGGRDQQSSPHPQFHHRGYPPPLLTRRSFKMTSLALAISILLIGSTSNTFVAADDQSQSLLPPTISSSTDHDTVDALPAILSTPNALRRIRESSSQNFSSFVPQEGGEITSGDKKGNDHDTTTEGTEATILDENKNRNPDVSAAARNAEDKASKATAAATATSATANIPPLLRRSSSSRRGLTEKNEFELGTSNLDVENKHAANPSMNMKDNDDSQRTRRKAQVLQNRDEDKSQSSGPVTDEDLPLERCFLMNDRSPYSNSDGVVVSQIPVSQEELDMGIFVQDVDSTVCRSHKVGCETAGSVFCSNCIFDEKMWKRKSSDIYKDDNVNDLMPICRPDVKRIAETCKQTDCIRGFKLGIDSRKSVDENEEQEGDYEEQEGDYEEQEGDVDNDGRSTKAGGHRRLISYDNVLGNDKANWMHTLYGKLGSESWRVKLKHFVLPGSHNSAAYNMQGGGSWCNNSGASGIVKNSDDRNRVAKCQSQNLRSQLDNGIRYLDLRVVDSSSFGGRRYPLVHTYLINGQDETMEDAISTIRNFLARHWGEFVIARIKVGSGCGKGGDWKNEFRRLVRGVGNVEIYDDGMLNKKFEELRGKAIFDIGGKHEEAYFANMGVDGDEYGPYDGNPFEVVRELKRKHTNYSNRFDIWSFFPAPSSGQLVGALANGAWFDGLEDWDANFQKHVWLMHSLILWYGPNVNVILRDRATTRKNIYHVATQLTSYRIFNLMAGTSKDHLDAVATNEWVNEYDEKFEHQCPPGWVLQGFKSSHNNGKEDRVWKFSCRRVNWLYASKYWQRGSGWIGSRPHDNIFSRNDDYHVMNSWDGEMNYGFYGCKYAITGIGGIHDNHREDRKYWVYYSVLNRSARTSECTWSGQKNSWDGRMDYQMASNQFVSRIYSRHDNHREDRIWKFCICTV